MRRATLRRRAPLKSRSHHAPTRTELDQLMREVVVVRDRVCRRCGARAKPGRGGGLEVAHIMPKGQWPALRHELSNVVLLCHRDHHYWWHRNPIEAVLWLEHAFGAGYADQLRVMALARSRPDPNMVRLYLTRERDRLLKL